MLFTKKEGLRIGYARVSTEDQSLDPQIDVLKHYSDICFQEKMSATKERPELQKALKRLNAGDTLVVVKLDRLGRSVKDLISIVEKIKAKGAHFKSLDGIDTSNSYGTFVFHIFSALAEMELNLIKERTKAGLKAARARGRIGGRPKGVSLEGKRKAFVVKSLYDSGVSIAEICKQCDTSKATIYKYLRLANGSPNRDTLVKCEKSGYIRPNRQKGLSEEAQKQAQEVKALYEQGLPLLTIAKKIDISVSTIYKYLRFLNIEPNRPRFFDKKAKK
jgi:DNA invertase Pin-like site-specific DNA recombinase